MSWQLNALGKSSENVVHNYLVFFAQIRRQKQSCRQSSQYRGFSFSQTMKRKLESFAIKTRSNLVIISLFSGDNGYFLVKRKHSLDDVYQIIVCEIIDYLFLNFFKTEMNNFKKTCPFWTSMRMNTEDASVQPLYPSFCIIQNHFGYDL